MEEKEAIQGMKQENETTGTDGFLPTLEELFEFRMGDAAGYSPLTLAFIGDAVYELVVRTMVLSRGNAPVNKLNHKKTFYSKASTQAAIARSIAEELTTEEEAACRRGRNAKSYTTAKNASMSDYRHATGLEALCGYLYLSGKERRLMELLKKGFAAAESLPDKEKLNQVNTTHPDK